MVKLLTLTPPSTIEVDLDNPFVTCALLRQLIAAEQRRGVTLQLIAHRAGVGVGTIRRLADGTTKEPRLATVIEVLRVMGYRLHARKSNR